MKGKTFTFVVLSGLCFLAACSPRVYFLVEDALPWSQADSYCREKYTDLASAHNSEEVDRLVAAAKKYFNGHVWIGLYDDIDSWRWSLEKEGYYGEGEAEFRMWDNGRPDNHLGHQNCAAMVPNGFWNDLSCKEQALFACYDGNEETVASSFIFVNQPKTWKEAQKYCRRHYTDLASVRNKTENEEIRKAAQSRRVWLGLHRDSWKWSDGSAYSFTNWNRNNNEPNGHISSPCGLAHSGKWEDNPCETKLFFVCQAMRVRQRMVRVKITKKDSSVNLEDAADAILQQFSQTLKDHGLSKDMKLAWRKQPGGKIFSLEEMVKEEKKEIFSCKQK